MSDVPSTEKDAGADERIEVLAEDIWDALDAHHDRAYHVHAAECCWPFGGSRDVVAAALAAKGQFATTQYILDIQWDRPTSDSPVLPPLVGPFLSQEEAREWGNLNIPNGSWEVRPIAWPYLQSTRVLPPASGRVQSDPHATNGRVSTVQTADGDSA